MTTKKYKLLADRFDAPAGSIVYKFNKYDYGLASDDTRYTGIEHISVTLNEDGDYPSFTVPLNQLKSIQ